MVSVAMRSTPCAGGWACCSSSARCFTDMTVFDNVAFPLREHRPSPELINDLVLMKLHAVGLRGAAQLMPGELSGGMARRVALARAIALDPMLPMADGPSPDSIRSPGVIGQRLIRRLNDALGASSVIVTTIFTNPADRRLHLLHFRGRVVAARADDIRKTSDPLCIPVRPTPRPTGRCLPLSGAAITPRCSERRAGMVGGVFRKHRRRMAIDGVWQLGFIPASWLLILVLMGPVVGTRLRLTIRELYFSGVLSLSLIIPCRTVRRSGARPAGL